MVEISEHTEQIKGEEISQKNDAAEIESSSKEDKAAWKELMGKDIQLKVCFSVSVFSCRVHYCKANQSDDKHSLALPACTQDVSEDTIITSKTECRPQDAVILDFVGRLADDRDDDDGPIFHEARDCLIVIGDKYVNPALEMGVRFMHEGQRAVLWSTAKFAYGLSKRKHGDFVLPPSSNVRYEIHVKTVISPDKESSDPDGFQLQLAKSKKDIANDVFKNELYMNKSHGGSQQRALRLYAKAADEMVHLIQTHQTKKKEIGDDYNLVKGQKITDQAAEIMLDCLNNIVAVHLKAENVHEAKEAAVKVLAQDPQNFKALLRAARAAMMDPSGTYEESEAAVAAAEKVVEEKGLDDKDIVKLRKELKQRKQEYKKRRKEMMARMTKELKPKDQKKTAEEEKNTNSATVGDETSIGEELDTPTTPLWRQLLPYVFQIVFPFVLYYAVVKTRLARLRTVEDIPDEHKNEF